MEQGLHIAVARHGCVCIGRNLGKWPVGVKRLFGVAALSASAQTYSSFGTLLEGTCRTPSERSSVDRRRRHPIRHPTPATDAVFGLASIVGLAVAVLALFLFGWLADEMLEGDTLAFDLRVRAATHALASPGLTHTLRSS